jgi:hypothetical protein
MCCVLKIKRIFEDQTQQKKYEKHEHHCRT